MQKLPNRGIINYEAHYVFLFMHSVRAVCILIKTKTTLQV